MGNSAYHNFSEIERPEGKYGISQGHFYINCNCGSSRGCTYKEQNLDENYGFDKKVGATISLEQKLPRGNTSKHMWYGNILVIKTIIGSAHDLGKLPVTLVFDNCQNEFPLTPGLYTEVTGNVIEDLDLL